jgi:ribulose-5-phosphate 4-epimerase/fuculose-1-phosphate aldolase
MHGAAVVGAYVEEAFSAALQLEQNAQFQLTASMLGPVDQLTPREVEQSNRESWKPNSIAKRWEYYRAKETRANPTLQEDVLQSSSR